MLAVDMQIDDRAGASRRLLTAIDALDVLIHIGPPAPSLRLQPEITTGLREQLQETRDRLQTALERVNDDYQHLLSRMLERIAGGEENG